MRLSLSSWRQASLVLAATFGTTLLWFSLMLAPAFAQTKVVGNIQYQPAISDDAADYYSLEIFGNVGSNVAFAGFMDVDADGNRTFSRVFVDVGANGTDIGPFHNVKPTAIVCGFGWFGY